MSKPIGILLILTSIAFVVNLALSFAANSCNISIPTAQIWFVLDFVVIILGVIGGTLLLRK